ncbi:hypothetical protein [Actinophytocola sp.]|uniref:hypothetical protein n=1 Tax=Actinophytocola sp. TaxID=1872138 RepID=UPI003D6AF1B8
MASPIEEAGTPRRPVPVRSVGPAPAALDALFESEGVDRVLLFCGYSPRAAGIQPIAAHDPVRFRLVVNVNPHLRHPLASEVERQRSLDAVGLKLHPVEDFPTLDVLVAHGGRGWWYLAGLPDGVLRAVLGGYSAKLGFRHRHLDS